MSALTDLTLFVTRDGDRLITDSRAVAAAFHKQHAHVLRTIEAMLRSKRPLIAEHAQSNFGLGFYLDANGQQRPLYRMTQRGLSELAMSFTGDDSREVRIRFLEAFDLVQKRLHQSKDTYWNQMHDIELDERGSEVKGKFGSRLMHERRREKPLFEMKRSLLQDLVQPSLFNLIDHHQGGRT